MRVPEPEMTVFLPKSLDWGMAAFGGRIELPDCASPDPREWDYEDLEIFFMTGRCHHLAISLARTRGYRIGVLFETDEEDLDGDPWIPHHVFAIDRAGKAVDVRGVRPLAQVIEDFAGTVGLVSPKVEVMGEARLRSEVIERRDRPLSPATEADIALAGRALERLGEFGRAYREVQERHAREFREREASRKAAR